MMARLMLILFMCTGLGLTLGCSSTEETSSDNQELVEDAGEAGEFDDEFGEGESETEGEQVATSEEAENVEGFEDQVEDEIAQFEDEAAQETSAPEEVPAVEEDPMLSESLLEEPVAETIPDEPVKAAPEVELTAIEFVSNERGGTVVLRTSSQASYKTRYNPDTQQFVVEVENAILKESLKRPFIMKDFDSSFGAINAYQNDGSRVARIVVQMKDFGEPVLQQEGNEILLISSGLMAKTEKKEEQVEGWKDGYDPQAAQDEDKVLGARTLDEFLAGNVKFFGRPISVQFNDADVKEVINFISDQSGVNIVIADEVTGNMTLKLRQIPWDQALVIVMRSKGLGYVREGSVIRVTKLETLQAEARVAKDIVDAQARLTPLKVKVIPVSYATVTEMIPQIQPFLTPERGKVVADSRTSSIIITDTANVLSRVERLVQELDLPPTQVMIEGKIVEAQENWTRNLGVNWGFSGVPTEISGAGGYQGNPINMATSFRSDGFSSSTMDGLSSLLSLTVGTVDFFGNLNAKLGLAQTDTMVKIISSPRIVTMNRAEAEISQKSEAISVSTQVDTNGNPTTTEVRTPIELKLGVVPQITAEGSVILDVNVYRQFASALVEETTQARGINTRSAKTKVLVPNGQTAVIGGIYQNDESQTESGVPYLKNIPVLGWLFKSKSEEQTKTELLIFLTPRILNPEEQKVGG